VRTYTRVHVHAYSRWQVEFDILFGSGIDKYGALLDAAGVIVVQGVLQRAILRFINKESNSLLQAESAGVVIRKGSWYAYNEQKFAQGKSNACEILRNDPVSIIQTNRCLHTRTGIRVHNASRSSAYLSALARMSAFHTNSRHRVCSKRWIERHEEQSLLQEERCHIQCQYTHQPHSSHALVYC
jgi:hypothetical protein